jgi:hypothetical protein
VPETSIRGGPVLLWALKLTEISRLQNLMVHVASKLHVCCGTNDQAAIAFGNPLSRD